MKFAILVNGKIRNNAGLVDCSIDPILKAIGPHQSDVFVNTWMDELSLKLVDNKKIRNLMLLEDPGDEYMRDIVGRNDGTIRHFRQFWRNKTSIEFVSKCLKKYDFFIYTRPDICIDFDLEEALLDSDSYMMPSNTGITSVRGNDLFGIATPENMLKAWDYKDTNSLLDLLKENDPEATLVKICANNGVPIKKFALKKCELIR